MASQTILWILFSLFVVGMLALDLGVFQRKPHVIHVKEALAWSVVWILLAIAFNGLIWHWKGPEAAVSFFTGYILEKSLSVDNLFVFLLIFSFFGVSPAHQHKVLYWGILGALIMRAIFIGVGVTLVHQFEWIFYVFGAFLVFTGVKMGRKGENDKIDLENSRLLRFLRRILPLTKEYEGSRFFVRKEGKSFVTPLFMVVLIVEATDVIFAVDSIPAVLGVTTDPFIVYSSNVFAILGLRSLYFALAGIMPMFRHLHYGLAAILIFIGFKMLIHDFFIIPVTQALAIVVVILSFSIVTSIVRDRQLKKI